MPFLKWEDKLKIGVTNMDAEHQQLIKMMNDLFDRNESGAAGRELGHKLNALIDYTLRHFSDEEAYMQSIGFPALEAHKAIHQSLIKTLKEHASKFNPEVDKHLPQALFPFLSFWLKAHIMGVDTKYAPVRTALRA